MPFGLLTDGSEGEHLGPLFEEENRVQLKLIELFFAGKFLSLGKELILRKLGINRAAFADRRTAAAVQPVSNEPEARQTTVSNMPRGQTEERLTEVMPVEAADIEKD